MDLPWIQEPHRWERPELIATSGSQIRLWIFMGSFHVSKSVGGERGGDYMRISEMGYHRNCLDSCRALQRWLRILWCVQLMPETGTNRAISSRRHNRIFTIDCCRWARLAKEANNSSFTHFHRWLAGEFPFSTGQSSLSQLTFKSTCAYRKLFFLPPSLPFSLSFFLLFYSMFFFVSNFFCLFAWVLFWKWFLWRD